MKDGDVVTNGNLTSSVPPGLLFNLAGNGGYPGVPSYGATTDLTTTNVSETGGLANSGYSVGAGGRPPLLIASARTGRAGASLNTPWQ